MSLHICSWANVFYITLRHVTDTGPCHSRMSFASPVILGSVFNLFSHQLHLEDHLRLYFADVLQARGEGLSQEGLHVDFIPLDPNTHFLIKPPCHVHWAKKRLIHSVCLYSVGSWIYFRGWVKLKVKLHLDVGLSLTRPESEAVGMNSWGWALKKIKYEKKWFKTRLAHTHTALH